MHVPEFEQATHQLAASEINRRWQERMVPFFEPYQIYVLRRASP
jgi:L-rhamnose mutarotase